jgi:thioredoxin reductase
VTSPHAGVAAESDVLVVGAGPAGIAVSACLKRAAVPHAIVEREPHIASSWRRHYERLHLHTVKEYSALPGAPWPADAPRYPSREQVVAYLTRYAADHAVQPELGVTVTRIARTGDRFVVETSHGTRSPRAVVMATGYNGVPTVPEIAGRAAFTGAVMHSRDYRHARPFIGRRTLVVGCGNSGAEIALDLAEQGVDVAMVVRGPVHVVPRDLLGRPSQKTTVLLSPLPVRVRDAIAGTMLRLAVGDLSRWGIVRPTIGPTRMIEENGRVPMLDIGTIAMVKAGRIRVVPAVASLTANTVHFVNGTVQPFDAIILATGYTPGLDRVIDGFAAVADARGRPRHFGAETDIPGLYFVGYRNPPTGALREIAREAPRVAEAIRARWLEGGTARTGSRAV